MDLKGDEGLVNASFDDRGDPETDAGAGELHRSHHAQDFTDEATARAWDADPASRNPARTVQLDILLGLPRRTDTAPARPSSTSAWVRAGSKNCSSHHSPTSKVVGATPIAGDAGPVAEARSGLASGADARSSATTCPTSARCGCRRGRSTFAFSVQTLHNIADRHKVEVIEWTFEGPRSRAACSCLLDRIAVEPPCLLSPYRAMWDRLGRLHGTELGEGRTSTPSTWMSLANRGDVPAGLESHLDWLRDAGFEVTCLHLHANRALIAGRKPGGESGGES